MAQALPITLGDQVRLHFVGWPEKVKGYDFANRCEVDVPHPKAGQPYVMTWNSRPYTVHPGQDVYIPFELAKKEFGDPRSLENVIRIKDEYGDEQIVPDRFAEVRRLQNYWQNSVIRFREYIPGDRSFAADGISDLLPIVEIYSMSGERILMVTDDPYGDTVVVEQRTRAEQTQSQAIMTEQSEAIIRLQKENEALLKKLGLRREDLLADLDLPPTKQDSALDTPTNATVDELPDKPKMVYNPKSKRVEPVRNPPPNVDPSSIMELPVDID